jgi:hypothetical protein
MTWFRRNAKKSPFKKDFQGYEVLVAGGELENSEWTAVSTSDGDWKCI